MSDSDGKRGEFNLRIKYVVCTYVCIRARTSTLPRLPRELDATGTRAQPTEPEAKCSVWLNWFYFI